MIITIPAPRFRNPRTWGNTPHLCVDPPSDPDKRAAFFAWLRCKWDTTPPDPAFLDLIIDGVECDMLTSSNPSPENVPLLVYLVRYYGPILEERGLLSRVLSLIRWAAVGDHPGESLRISRLALPTAPEDINLDLSALLKHKCPLRPFVAHHLCLILDYLRSGKIPKEHKFSLKEIFVNMFLIQWPDGFVLQQPTVTIPIIHHPGHPHTAALVAKDIKKYTHQGKDFLAEPLQFKEVLEMWDASNAIVTELGVARFADPQLRQLAAIPPSLLAETVVSSIRSIGPAFLTRDEIAVTLGCGDVSKFEFDVTLHPGGLRFAVEEIEAFFHFVIRIEPHADRPDQRHVTGSAIGIFSAAGEIYFDDIHVDNPGTKDATNEE